MSPCCPCCDLQILGYVSLYTSLVELARAKHCPWKCGGVLSNSRLASNGVRRNLLGPTAGGGSGSSAGNRGNRGPAAAAAAAAAGGAACNRIAPVGAALQVHAEGLQQAAAALQAAASAAAQEACRPGAYPKLGVPEAGLKAALLGLQAGADLTSTLHQAVAAAASAWASQAAAAAAAPAPAAAAAAEGPAEEYGKQAGAGQQQQQQAVVVEEVSQQQAVQLLGQSLALLARPLLQGKPHMPDLAQLRRSGVGQGVNAEDLPPAADSQPALAALDAAFSLFPPAPSSAAASTPASDPASGHDAPMAASAAPSAAVPAPSSPSASAEARVASSTASQAAPSQQQDTLQAAQAALAFPGTRRALWQLAATLPADAWMRHCATFAAAAAAVDALPCPRTNCPRGPDFSGPLLEVPERVTPGSWCPPDWCVVLVCACWSVGGP